ncbi:cysteine-rich CWC family protein [Pseudomaricurvus alcaniphilus]|uniref:cysteine-rich CWC family protein n=1 Tax=Pseudomaricurvus alcaniphilus TaxID=1166482 RepID=UPI001A9FB642
MAEQIDPGQCPLCGERNGCCYQAGSSDPAVFECWCKEVRVEPRALAQIPPSRRGQSCLCPRCAQSNPQEAKPAAKS